MNRLIRHTAILFAALTLHSCGQGGDGQAGAADSTDVYRFPDTLRVATLYSPTSYFIYREEQMGYDYTLVRELCRDKRMVLDLHVAPALERALEWLDSGTVDLVAYEVPVTDRYNELVEHCGPVTTTTQVLVQPKSKTPVRDVTELIGRDVYVEKNSKYWQRMQNLNSEVGGGINIHAVDRDTLITEDLLEMVAKGTIPLTVVDSDVALLNRTYYPKLDIDVALSFGQKAEWGVAKGRKWLADSINAWLGDDRQRQKADAVYKRYFEMSKTMPSMMDYEFKDGHISPFDNIFRRHAGSLDWDWRLLAAQGYVESKFDRHAVSWAGARGIMQIMPGTARGFGYEPDEMVDPETSVIVAVKLLESLEKTLSRFVEDPVERRQFVIAGYNSGIAHILDAITLAKKTGRNPQRWKDNVELAILLEADPRYYNDPDVKYGYFRARQTVEYVDRVSRFYELCKEKVKG